MLIYNNKENIIHPLKYLPDFDRQLKGTEKIS